MADLNVNTNQGEIRYLTPLDISTKNSTVDSRDLE
jgi:hypothetical protein